MMEDDVILKFLEMFSKTPSNMLVILFAVFALKKWLINSTVKTFLHLQQQKCTILENILGVLTQIDEKEEVHRAKLQDVLSLVGRRREDIAPGA